MSHHKSKRRPPDPESGLVIGIGWYDPEQWAKLKQVAADVEALDDTYEEWLRGARHMEKELSDKGLTVRRVKVNVDSLQGWCADRHKPLNGEARADYIAELVQGIQSVQ